MWFTVISQVSGSPGPLEINSPVEFQRVEIVIPRYSHDGYIAFQQAADNVMFHAAIDENHPFFSGTVCNDFFAAYMSDLIDEIGIDKIDFVFILKNDFSFHATLFPEQFGQFARIDTRDARYFFFFQPFAEAFHGSNDCNFRSNPIR